MTVYTGLAFIAVNPFAVTGNHLVVPLDERDRTGKATRELFP